MDNAIKKIGQIFILMISIIGFSQERSTIEIIDMKFMVEEEKVARDVYERLDDKWDLRIFSNIKQSEQRHLDMMENLLNTNKIDYEISDEQGVFYNKELQQIYDDLIEKGLKSQYDALQVGKQIEETDIADLEEAIANTKDIYLKQVYSNLLRASENHLRAFNRQLSRY